ncbi:lysine--tRNA ligase [Candidatus Persebacteraceae bacterium Df01]|jgi:lysyl-tRNA synthetase class 2|uniref:Lysine--tRNA ligase n=1 Tax=Candidatus Doriopsillibacter californiensis TaxID=2970740 RepID=A0ABT7QKW1_9GAMM|nr:lysine--tRNA ligase [Candidatus Persebacteraceae bacterium Df01]
MTDDLHAIRRHKLDLLRARGDAYPNDFKPTHSADALHKAHGDKNRESLADQPLLTAIAGRIMLRRQMGKAIFVTVQDDGTRMQIYATRDGLGEEGFSALMEWDIGDIIGCEGTLFKTKMGELTVRASALRLLVKSLQPPPEKFHGIAAAEMRYRRRYVSLTANSDERDVFVMRSGIIRHIRDFFHARDYLEAETPILQPIPGGAAASPFVTHCNALNTDFYLRIAQELYIKRLLVGGFNRVFEINRNFRNEGISTRHNPEFTMLEFNAAYHDCEDFMQITEELLHGLVVQLTGNETITYQGQTLDFKRPFARLSPVEAVLREHPEISEEQLHDEVFLRSRLASEGEVDTAKLSLGELQLLLFEYLAEFSLIQPTFLVNYPAAASPLARRRSDNSDIAERFEMFAAGRELVNGFSELNDPDVQAEIFRQQAAKKSAGDEEAMHYDDDYILALQYGLPPNAGGGIGIDRLAMLLSDSPSIRDVILFPQLRPVGGE